MQMFKNQAVFFNKDKIFVTANEKNEASKNKTLPLLYLFSSYIGYIIR